MLVNNTLTSTHAGRPWGRGPCPFVRPCSEQSTRYRVHKGRRAKDGSENLLIRNCAFGGKERLDFLSLFSSKAINNEIIRGDRAVASSSIVLEPRKSASSDTESVIQLNILKRSPTD